jgi:hypothetical protein
MPTCPFAVSKPIAGSPGGYAGGHPFKIVHHTTEGSTAEGAFQAYGASGNIPHFTVDDMTVYQHADTAVAVSALRHPAGGTETNRSSASLRNMARLCRWIETTHGVPQVWPNGLPKPPVNGQDPGGHVRNQQNWDTQGGHYGHCHVPGNTHWDPAYTPQEVETVMQHAAPTTVAAPGDQASVMDDHGASGLNG